MAKLFANSGDSDQMLYSVASDLGLLCLPVTLLGVSRLKWVKGTGYIWWIFCHILQARQSDFLFSFLHAKFLLKRGLL